MGVRGMKVTQNSVREQLRAVGVVFATVRGSHPTEFRVKLREDEGDGYFTTDLQDALATGLAFARHWGRLPPESNTTNQGQEGQTQMNNKSSNPFDGAPLAPAPQPLTADEVAAAIREYRVRRQRKGPSDPVRPWAQQHPKPVTLWTDVECIAYLLHMCEQQIQRGAIPVRVLGRITERVRDWLDGQELEETTDLQELYAAVDDKTLDPGAALERAYKLGWQERGNYDAAKVSKE